MTIDKLIKNYKHSLILSEEIEPDGIINGIVEDLENLEKEEGTPPKKITPKIFNVIQLAQAYAKSNNKFCMYISFDNTMDWKELEKAAPYLTTDQLFHEGTCILTFDTEVEMQNYYNLTVGDDGPTKLNSYNGEARVYALTITNTGELSTENT